MVPARSSLHVAFDEALARGPLLLSGGLGTELLRRGVPTPLPLWATDALLHAPETVRAIHADYVRAGARVVTANTFRMDKATLARAGLTGRARDLHRLAVRLAREGVAAARPAETVFVAGSLGPLADCYEPDAVPDDATLKAEHGVRVGHLVAAGADLALVETMNTAREACAALGACRAAGLPALVSFVCGPDARLLSGEPIVAAADQAAAFAPLAVLVNCCALAHATEALRALIASGVDRAGVYANGRGRPDPAQGWAFRGGASRRAYVQAARQWLRMGAHLVGGCCGTDPRTIRALARLVRRAP